VSQAEKEGLITIARSYGVSGQVDELLSVSKELNRSGLQPSECVAGSKIVKTLRDLGVNESRFSGFIQEVYSDAVEQGLKPKELVGSCSELRRLRKQTGKGYQAILDDYEDKHLTNERLKSENIELENKRRQLKNQLNQEVRDKDATLQTLEAFNNTRESLKRRGVDVEELNKLAVLLLNVSEKSYDPEDITIFYSETRDLEEKKSSLEVTVSSLEAEATALEKENRALQETISDNQGLVEKISEIDSMGLKVENVTSIVQKVMEISSRHELTREKALEKFFSDIDEQYEAKLGYENEANRLKARRSRINDEIEDMETKHKRLEKIFAEKKSVYDRLIDLNEKGVSNEDLVHWDEIIRDTNMDLISIRREIARLGGLRQWLDDKNKDKIKLEGEIESLKNEIESLKTQKENFEAELNSLRTGALAEVKRELTRLPGIIDDLRVNLLNPETGLKAKSLEMVEDTK
jgi:chromosome segregation ATPase